MGRLVIVAALLAGCTPSGASITPGPSAPAMSQPPSVPAATPDAARFATGAGEPSVTVRGEETTAGVTVTDLSFGDAEIASTDAYLAAPSPAAAAPGPAIIWFHWLESGAPTSNRTEFLDEARALAQQGVVSLLVQGTLPWVEPPSSIAHDVPLIEREVKMLRRGIDLLLARPDVDPARVAAVGHDFGGMYLTLLFGADARVGSLVVMAATARWADWFVRYWSISDAEDAYGEALAPLDPITWLPQAGDRPVLLQFGSSDRFLPEPVAAELIAAAGESAENATYNAGHELDAEARAARDAWLSAVLELPPPN